MTKKSQRNAALEILRIIAAFGVVAYHSKVPHMEIPYAGLIIFTILSPYVDAKYLADHQRSTKDIIKTFFLPWSFWSIIYGIINIATNRPVAPPGGNAINVLLSGTSMHLWFMPFMCIFLILFNLIKIFLNVYLIYYISFAVIIAFFINYDLWLKFIENSEYPYAQWIHAAPSLFIGIAFGISDRVPYGKLLFLPTMAIVASQTILLNDLPGINPTYPIGIILFVFFSLIKLQINSAYRIIQSIASCSLGIYMTHMIWVGLYNKIIGRENWVSAICAFFSSLIFIWFARKIFPKTKYIL